MGIALIEEQADGTNYVWGVGCSLESAILDAEMSLERVEYTEDEAMVNRKPTIEQLLVIKDFNISAMDPNYKIETTA